MSSVKHECEKRGCKTKKPEVLCCMPGYGFPKDKIDTRWFCEPCFEEVNGENMRDFQAKGDQSSEATLEDSDGSENSGETA